jgi:hypothetical protein
MALVRAIVYVVDGKMSVEKRPGKFDTFSIPAEKRPNKHVLQLVNEIALHDGHTTPLPPKP